eukprot:COSAG04_NODE_5945_length_1449_cov_1.687407_3_plen_54_part_01
MWTSKFPGKLDEQTGIQGDVFDLKRIGKMVDAPSSGLFPLLLWLLRLGHDLSLP